MSVCIGPKLPLSMYLEPTYLNSSYSSIIEHIREPEHIVLKIYTCPKCSHKCTDSVLHEDHVFACNNNKSMDTISLASEPNIWNGLYWCDTCLFKFKNVENLKIHMEKHRLDKGFACSICQLNFPTVNVLRSHCKEFHKGLTNIFSCNICDYSSVTSKLLKTHVTWHNSDKHLYCYICRRNYENSTDFDTHLLKKHKNKTTKEYVGVKKRSQIEKSMKNEKNVNLSKLQLKFLDEIILKDNLYFCNGCPYKFSKIQNLKLHKKQHISINIPYKCVSCEFETLSLVELKTHISTHSEKPKFECNICIVSFSDWRSLNVHAASHVYDELFCWQCKCNFEDVESLQLHLSFAHEYNGNNLHSCSKCSFKHYNDRVIKSHLKHHERQGYRLRLEGIQKESICDSKHLNYSEVAALQNNCKTRKLQNKNELKIEQPHETKFIFKCSKCDYTCSQYKTLTQHNSITHLHKGDPYKCSVCDFKSIFIKSYIEHATLHANGITYACRYCKYATKQKSKFEEHNLVHQLKSCPMCSFKSLNTTRFVEHLRIHKRKNGNNTFSCSLCPYFCCSIKILSTHTLKHHPKEFMSTKLPFPVKYNLSLNSYSCTMCTFRSRRSHDFKRHLITHFTKRSNIFNKLVVSKSNVMVENKKINRNKNKQNLNLKKENVMLKAATLKRQPLVIKEDNKSKDCRLSANDLKKNDSSIYYYKCSQCQYKKTNRRAVVAHLQTMHNISGGVRNSMILKVSAPKCRQEETSNRTTISLNHTINGSDYYQCTQCAYRMTSRRSVANHLLLKHNMTGGLRNNMILKVPVLSKQVKSSIVSETLKPISKIANETRGCSKNIKQSELRKTSISPDTKTNNVKCSKCKIHTFSHIAQIDHLKNGHTAFWKKPFSCRICGGSRFVSKQSFVKHNARYHVNSFKCEICQSYETHDRDSLVKHQENCLNSMIEEVMEDENQCAEKNSLDNHQLKSTINEEESQVSDDESYSCGECEYVSHDVTDLITHMFVHTGIPDD